MFDQESTAEQAEMVFIRNKIVALTHARECEVLSVTIFGSDYRLAYISSPLSHFPLPVDFLKANDIDAVFEINNMPVKDDGEVDIKALELLLPPLASIKKVIEAEAARHQGVKDVLALELPSTPKVAPLHVRSLLPSASQKVETRFDEKNDAGLASLTKASKSSSSSPDALVRVPAIVKPTRVKTLTDLIVQRAKVGTGSIKFLDGSEEATLSIAQLLKQARCLRNGLIDRGVTPGRKVIIHSDKASAILSAFWACILGGMVPVITPVAPMYKADASEVQKLKGLVELFENPVLLLTAKEQSELINIDFAGLSGCAFNNIFLIEELLLNDQTSLRDDYLADEGDVAFYCLSSGSTGTPKCIQMTHKNVLIRSEGANYICQNKNDDVILNWLPFDHIGSISDWHIRCVDVDCHMIYCSKDMILTDPIAWIELIHQYRVSHTWAPNFAYSAVNAALKAQQKRQDWDLSCVQVFLTAAETVSSETISEFSYRLSSYGLQPNCVSPAFGMAEMGSGVTYNQTRTEVPIFSAKRSSLHGALQQCSDDEHDSLQFTCLGSLIPSMSMRVVSKEGEVLKEGNIGHLHMKGDCVSPGYYKNEDANAVFLNDGWMDTGDEGFIQNECLYLSGRSKDTIIIGGSNYLPIEIEQIVEEIEGIATSYVAATAVKLAGDTEESLAVFFCLIDAPTELKSVLESIKERVPSKVGISPNYLICLPKSELPKTAIGKIQRSQLSSQLACGDFDKQLCEADLLLENSRTIPHWFVEKRWLRSKRQSSDSETIAALGYLTLGKASSHYAERLVARSKLRFVNINSEKVNSDSISHFFCREEKGWRNLVCLLSVDDFNQEDFESNFEIIIRLVRKIKQSFDVFSNKERIVISFVTIDFYHQGPFSKNSILAKSIPALWRSVFPIERNIKNIAVDSSEASTECLLRELRDPLTFGETLIDLSERYVSKLVSCDALTQVARKQKLRKGALYVISGGLGGVGRELCKRLLSKYKAKIIIIGRASEAEIASNDDKYRCLDELQSLGQVYYFSFGSEPKLDINHAILRIENNEQQSVAGFFHLAGSSNEASFDADADAASEARFIFDTKVASAVILRELFIERSDAFIVYFSSTLSEITSSSTPIYALANRALDNMAEFDRSRSRQSYSIAWSAWKNTGMSSGVNAEALLEAQGLFTLPVDRALNSLEIILSRAPRNVLVGVNRFSNSLVSLVHNPVALKQNLHLAYTKHHSNQSIESDSVKEKLKCSRILSRVETTELDELTRLPNGDFDLDKICASLSGFSEFTPANTELEKHLSTLWCEVLELDRVSINDNFFALGGHSLLAAELINKINKTLSLQLALGFVFEASTIREQAKGLQFSSHKDLAQIIPLQKHGQRRPLFCLCGIELYQELANQLAPDTPVYGIYLPIEGKLLEPANLAQIRVETMAKDYVKAMKSVQAQGPYRVLGISFGGVLAYESARQLRAMGDSVELLGILDFVLPTFLVQKHFELSMLLKMDYKALLESQFVKLKQLLRRHQLDKKSGAEPDQRVLVQRAYKQAWKRYKTHIEYWDDPSAALIFRSKDEVPQRGYSKSISCGWEQLMEHAPEAHLIPGDHLGLLKEPNVNILAEKLKSRLLD